MGDVAAFSFHETKNIHCGEGGALVVNRVDWIQKAQVARDKGTNRSQFIDGLVDKYTWTGKGSSYLMSEYQAAVLLAQLEDLEMVTAHRHSLWQEYHRQLEFLEDRGALRRLKIPHGSRGNGHIYAVVFESIDLRRRVQAALRGDGIGAQTHYVPLHSSPAGKILGATRSPLPVTERYAEALLRLPIHMAMKLSDVETVTEGIRRALGY